MTRSARSPHSLAAVVALCVGTASLLAACTGTPDPAPTSEPAPTAEETTTAAPSPEAPSPEVPSAGATATAPALAPGDPCDPAAGDPDCTDATTDGTFRYVEDYTDCVAEFAEIGEDEAYGLCTDLDGDGVFGYPTQ